MIDSGSTVTSPLGVQKIGKETSPILPKEKDPNVNLRDRLNDVLINEKYIMSVYGSGLNEIIDQNFLNLATQNLDTHKMIHRNMFDQLFNLGEYQADIATPQQIADTLDIFKNYEVQLPYPRN